MWSGSGGPNVWGEKPRLVVDREVVDLGDLPFDTPARVVFTLTISAAAVATMGSAQTGAMTPEQMKMMNEHVKGKM